MSASFPGLLLDLGLGMVLGAAFSSFSGSIRLGEELQPFKVVREGRFLAEPRLKVLKAGLEGSLLRRSVFDVSFFTLALLKGLDW